MARKSKPTGTFLVEILDQFSTTSLKQWEALAQTSKEVELSVFYELQAQREANKSAILAALREINPTARTLSDWYRIVDFRYALEPLSATGSRRISGRFNIGADIDPGNFPIFPALYLAENYDTAFAEKFCQASQKQSSTFSGEEFALRTPGSFSAVRINGKIETIFDLTNSSNLKPLIKIINNFNLPAKTIKKAFKSKLRPPTLIRSSSELQQSLLSENWRGQKMMFDLPANPQIIGRLLRDAGFEAVLYKSVKGPGLNLAVFPENLHQSSSYIELSDTAPSEMKVRRLDSETWKELS